MTTTDDLIKGLNDLLEKTYDAEKGYQTAKDNTESNRLKEFFGARSQQRYQYGHEIKEAIQRLGGKPDKGGSVTGAVHRGWINFKSALSFDTEESILEECERGEEASVKAYDEFITSNTLPTWLSSVIYKQRNGIAKSLKTVEHLEEVV